MKIPQAVTLGTLFKTPPPPEVLRDYAEQFMDLHKLQSNFEFPDSKSIMGIEIEVENVKRIDPNLSLGFWKIDEDGSLRNNGREFISHPLKSMYIEPALTHVFSCINDDIDFSPRTSIHVHLNARTFTPENLCSFVMTYLVVENLLFKYAGNNRRSNIYCVPIQDTSIFDKLPKEWGVATVDIIRRHWSKYTALNLLPLADKGTVEFRHLPGTNDVKRIMVWIAMIQRLKLYAFSNDHKRVIETISGLNTNSAYRNFVESVFLDYYHYLDLSNLQVDMEEAVTLVKHCAMSNDFHQAIIQKSNLESHYAKVVLGQKVDKLRKRGTISMDNALDAGFQVAFAPAAQWNVVQEGNI